MNQNEKDYLIQKIRTQYTEKEHTELDELKELDKKVKSPAIAFAYSFGTISALIMGSGMSLIMTDISDVIGLSDATVPGLIIGIAGLVMCLINYPIYKKFLNSRRRKYAGKIVSLSDSIMNS